MSIDPVSGSTAAAGTSLYATTPTRAPSQSLDSEAFMKLLVTQLSNQDPGSPMDTNQMISQTTQLAVMEKLTELTTTGQEDFALQMRVAASQILGNTVSYTDAAGKTVTGTAQSVSFAEGVPKVTVDGVEVSLDAIAGMSSKASSAA